MNIAYYNQDGFTIPLAQSLPQVVVIDSALVSVHTIELPRMSKSKLINAIAFKLEEAVLSDIDQLEFIPFKQSSPNIWDVIVIDRSVLTDIKNKLLNANIQPISIVPDFMLLAKHSNKVVISRKIIKSSFEMEIITVVSLQNKLLIKYLLILKC
jgi:type II secretory pathway component PulL